MSPLRRFLKFFFWHFYHGFAWTYDTVAAVVSIGRWQDWVRSVMPFVRGTRVLEIGHGPGHLQVTLRSDASKLTFGLDESPQMVRMAAERLHRAQISQLNLMRADGQHLPFAARTFDTVLATFPTEYIFEPETTSEVRRILCDEGRFVVVPAAWIIGRTTVDRLAAWLFRATDQVPHFPAGILAERIRPQLEQAGFVVAFETVEIRSSEVLVVIASPLPNGSGQSRRDS